MKQHEVWLFKAESDLNSAKKLMEGETPVPDTAIYMLSNARKRR